MTPTKEDLKTGKTYRGKRRRMVGLFGEFDDRTIIWMGDNELQYDSPSVRMGRHFPRVSIEQFLRWAKEEVVPQEGGA